MAPLDGTEPTVRVEVAHEHDIAIISVTGELDFSNVHLLRDATTRSLHPGSPLTFDLGALTFIDSSGLAVLIEAAQQANPLVLRNTPDKIRRVIAATGLTDLFGTA